MTDIIIAILGSGLFSGAFATVVGVLVARANEKQKQEHGVNAGVQILLYDRIKYLCKHHIEKGYVTVEDLEDLERMHKIYHDELKGNGFLDSLMVKVRVLPNDRVDV